MINIVAFMGPEGSGKSYNVWKNLREFSSTKTQDEFFIKHRYGNHLFNDGKYGAYAFAQPLKTEVSEKTGLDYDIFENPSTKDTFHDALGMTPRNALIEHATMVRQKDVDWYTNLLITRIKEEKPQVAYISDLRFDYEIKSLYDHFGVENVNIIHL